MNNKNLFIVATPLQFLNAIEAKETFKTAHNILILKYNTYNISTNANQMKELVNEEEWESIIHYHYNKIPKHKRFSFQVKLIKSLKKFSYDYIFSGEFGIKNQAFISNLKSKSIYLLDDGNATLLTYDKIKEKKYLYRKVPFSKKMRLLRYLLVNLKYKIEQDIHFFTTFDIKSTKNIKVIKHDFTHLKANKLQNCKKDNTIYILGQNLAEAEYIKKEIYLHYLEKISAKYNENIIYIPHRYEIVDSSYNHLINDSFTIKPSEGPIEASFINKGIYPKIIISFISSALFNLDKIFSDSKIYAIKIDSKDLIKNQEIMEKCYNAFENTGVEVIHIKHLLEQQCSKTN